MGALPGARAVESPPLREHSMLRRVQPAARTPVIPAVVVLLLALVGAGIPLAR